MFPLHVCGRLRGILGIGPRSDEHYATDERELFAGVAHEMGAAPFALRAQATETLLDEERSRNAALPEALRTCGAPEGS